MTIVFETNEVKSADEKNQMGVPATPAIDPYDPFDPANLRLDVSYTGTVGVKKHLTTIRVGKPGKQEFFRIHPSPEYRLEPAAIIELKEDRETYAVAPHLAPSIEGHITKSALFLGITRQKAVFLLTVTLPTEDGRRNNWHQSKREAAELGMNAWVRMAANM